MTNATRQAVVLLSGGVDSSTVLAIARHEGFNCIALSFDYGQRHRVELEAAKRVAAALGAGEHRIVAIDMRAIGGSALTADIDVPKDRAFEPGVALTPGPSPQGRGEHIPPPSEGGGEGVGGAHYESSSDDLHGRESHPLPSALPQGRGSKAHAERETIPATYVPARNTIFLSVALAVAEACGARDIFIGVNAIDYSGYPDCRPAFIEAFEKLANIATKAGVEGENFRVHAPLIQMTKKEIIERGIALGVDYALTMSCYDPRDVNGKIVACGRCDSCRLREEGFRAAGMRDPAMIER